MSVREHLWYGRWNPMLFSRQHCLVIPILRNSNIASMFLLMIALYCLFYNLHYVNRFLNKTHFHRSRLSIIRPNGLPEKNQSENIHVSAQVLCFIPPTDIRLVLIFGLWPLPNLRTILHGLCLELRSKTSAACRSQYRYLCCNSLFDFASQALFLVNDVNSITSIISSRISAEIAYSTLS